MKRINMKNLGLTESFMQESKQYKNLFIARVSQYKNHIKLLQKMVRLLQRYQGNSTIESKTFRNFRLLVIL